LFAAQNFEFEFAKIYPNFTKNLINLNGGLTYNEVKVCMLIRMAYSNKQILKLMNLSDSTLFNLRSGIRKKLNLDRDQSLFTLLSKL